MKLREVVYWVVILLQVMLLTGVKEKEVCCKGCNAKGYPSQMIHERTYGWFHPDCAPDLPQFNYETLDKPVRDRGRHPKKLIVQVN